MFSLNVLVLISFCVVLLFILLYYHLNDKLQKELSFIDSFTKKYGKVWIMGAPFIWNIIHALVESTKFVTKILKPRWQKVSNVLYLWIVTYLVAHSQTLKRVKRQKKLIQINCSRLKQTWLALKVRHLLDWIWTWLCTSIPCFLFLPACAVFSCFPVDVVTSLASLVDDVCDVPGGLLRNRREYFNLNINSVVDYFGNDK